MELEYSNQKSLSSQVFNKKVLQNHLFPAYDRKISQDDFKSQPNMEILDKTFDEVYQGVLKREKIIEIYQ